jgi:cytochrome c oxidase subunit I+III
MSLPEKSSVKRWLVTTNHKDIGILYLLTATFFLVFAGVLALLIRVQLLETGGTILAGGEYNQVVTAHGLLMVFWFLSPFAFGFANYLVPLQIGADDLAFPRLNAMSYWLYLFSGIAMLLSFFQGGTHQGGWTLYAPLNVPAFVPRVASIGETTAIIGLALFVTSVTLGSVNFLTTMYRMRAEGLRMRDVPLFSISILLTVWMMLFAFAALLAATILLGSDHLLGTQYFTSEAGGSMLWAHLFWFFGHPEVYIVFFPALGALAEIVQTFSGRRLVGRKWFVIAMALVAIQSFMVWMHHMFLTTINLPIKTVFMVTTVGISLPFDLMVFALIYTMVKGKVRWKTPFLFALGALLIFILGGITGVFLGAIVLDYQFRGTYWVVAHFHYAMASAAVALIGALYYWFPKITGKMYNEFLGKVHFVAAFAGFNLLYFPMFIVWEHPRRYFDYAGTVVWEVPIIDTTIVDAGFTVFHAMATAGAFLFAASFLVMFYNLFTSMYSDRVVEKSPWAYTGSAEWSTESPPPTENFPGTPTFANGRLNFLRESESTDGGVRVLEADGSEATTDGGHASADAGDALAAKESAHADHASWTPLLVSTSILLAAVGLSGLSAGSHSYVVWSFVLSLPVFIGSIAAIGALREGRTRTHDVLGLLSVGVLAGLLLFGFEPTLGIVDGFTGASPYFYATLAGTSLGAITLTIMGYESFEVPEPRLNEAWPFENITNTKLGMWMFLGSDIILFGALIGSFVFIRFQSGWTDWWHDAALAEEAHQVLPGLINTYLLLASSFTVVLAMVYARRGNKRRTMTFLWLTFIGAAGFLVNKGYEWYHFIVDEGFTHTSDVMGSTFFVTTGLHAAHVIVGMIIVLFLIARASNGAYWSEDEDAHTIEYYGLYWHFVDIVWLFLFPLFYIL